MTSFKIKEMENVAYIKCPDCRRTFSKLSSLNKHIVRTGHNDSRKYTQLDILKIVYNLKIGKNQIILSIPA